MTVPCAPGGCVHDYVPLYFGATSLMLLGVINAKNIDQKDILYFEFPIDLTDRPDAVFTDASANTSVPPNFFNDAKDLDKLNWAEIDSKKWSSATDKLRHERMAELLVHTHLSVTDAARCVVWNEESKAAVEAIVKASGVAFPKIEFQTPPRYHWFVDFQNKKQTSLVTGPREIAQSFEATFTAVISSNSSVSTASYPNLRALLDALETNFGATPQTAELIGLKSENGIHKKTVDLHTLDVVNGLQALPGYQDLDPKYQRLVRLAAYLHDIGKGPKSRWTNNGGVQKVDPNHPVNAMPLMADILINQVANVKASSARRLLKLVCYHDLVGDIIGRGRDEEQLVAVAENRLDLDMLIVLGQADASALQEKWEWNFIQKAASLRTRCAARLLSDT